MSNRTPQALRSIKFPYTVQFHSSARSTPESPQGVLHVISGDPAQRISLKGHDYHIPFEDEDVGAALEGHLDEFVALIDGHKNPGKDKHIERAFLKTLGAKIAVRSFESWKDRQPE